MGFLGKARKMIGGKGTPEPLKPQYYQVTCAEGHVIRGERAEGYQALRCPHCGEGVFVLPRSPLPLPPTPAPSRAKRRPSAPIVDDRPIELTEAPAQEELEEIQWLEPPPPSPVSNPAPRPKPATRPVVAPAPGPSADPILEAGAAEADEASVARSRPRPRTARPRPKPAPAPSRPDEAPPPGQIRLPAQARRRAPVAGIVLGIVVLVGGTVAYRLWRQRLQDLPHEAEIHRTEGLAALEAGQFDEARKRLGQAAVAYRTLQATDTVAATTAQLADEAAILATLSHDTLKEIVEEVARLGDPDGIARFDAIHQGQAVLVDSVVESINADRVELDYRIFVGRGPTPANRKPARLDLSGFKLLAEPTRPGKGDRVLFGARLGSIRLEDGEWRVTLDPDSGVRMTNEKALQAAGLAPNPSGESAP